MPLLLADMKPLHARRALCEKRYDGSGFTDDAKTDFISSLGGKCI